MKKETYYRYLCGKESVFGKVLNWFNTQTKKRYGERWAKESAKLTSQINKSISWLPEYKERKDLIYYFTEKGADKCEKTLLKIHKKILKRRIIRKKFEFLIKNLNGEKIIYNNKKRIGRLFHKDKYQIGVKR